MWGCGVSNTTQAVNKETISSSHGVNPEYFLTVSVVTVQAGNLADGSIATAWPRAAQSVVQAEDLSSQYGLSSPGSRMGVHRRQRVRISFATGSVAFTYYAFSPAKRPLGDASAQLSGTGRTPLIECRWSNGKYRVAESLVHAHPGTNEVIEFTIVASRIYEGKGRWFAAACTGNPDLEVGWASKRRDKMVTTSSGGEDR